MATPRMHRVLAIALTVLVGAIVALVVPAGASAQVEGGVGFRVAQEPGSSLDAGYLTIEAAAGQSASGYFFMTNGGSTAAQLRIYPADGLTGVTSGVVYSSAGDALAEAGAWLTPSLRSAILPATSERRVDFSVRVPPGAAQGDHVGSIVLEQKGRGSANVAQIVRNVVPIRIIVPGARGPQVNVRTAKITGLNGTVIPAVIVGLRNSGPRMCAPTLSVALRGPSERGATVSRQLDAILPGDRIPYPLPWPRSIEPGSYVARVTASGCGVTDSITVELDAPDLSATNSDGTSNPGGRGNGAGAGNEPGQSTFKPGDQTRSGKAKKKSRKSTDRTRVSGEDTAGAAGLPGAGGAGGPGAGQGAGAGGNGAGAAGEGADGKGVGAWISKAAGSVAEAAPEVIKRATIPLLLLLLIGLVFFVQEAIDRRDPKLALAPLHREPHLPFDPNPLHPRVAGSAVPSATALRPDL